MKYSLSLFSKSLIVRDYLWRLLQYLSKTLILIVFNFYAASILSPEGYGEVVYVLALVGIVEMFANFGLSATCLKKCAEYTKQGTNREISTLVFSVSVFSTIVSFVGFVILSFLFTSSSVNILYLLPYLLSLPLISVLDGMYVGMGRFKEVSRSTVIPTLISALIGFFLISYFGIKGLLLSYSFYNVLLLCFYIYKTSFSEYRFSLQIVRDVLRYSIIVGLGSLSFFLYSRVDVFILEYFSFTKEIGYYELVMKSFQLLVLPVIMLGQVVSPKAVRDKDDLRRLSKYYQHIPSFLFIGSLFLICILFFLGPILIQSYLNAYYTQDFLLIFNVLLLVLPLKFIGVYMTNGVITPLGYAKLLTITTFFFGVCNVFFDFILIERYGFIGVFYATLICHNANIMSQYVLFRIKIKK
ncbi:flippase [Fulvitalea axinellae]|uniref:Flippase n=1 Tax=Fulvitalea axinellae TaxID=1182444 RepID=A0AAU9CGV3_9BACT|nr:flippase [Fulvitalea axinellae]